jgi:hypothetical protein
VLTPTAARHLPLLAELCGNALQNALDRYSLAGMVKADPFDVPSWHSVIEANDPESFTTASPVPLLIIQGGADEQIPPVTTQLLAQHLCGVGQVLERWIYPGEDHMGVIAPSAGDMVHWIADRFRGETSPDPYVPDGMSGIQTATCPS